MGNKNHGWLMLLGCGLMLAAVFFLFRGAAGNLGLGLNGTSGASLAQGAAGSGTGGWIWLLFLACPLLHLLMMRGHGGHGCAKGESKEQAGEKQQAENKGK